MSRVARGTEFKVFLSAVEASTTPLAEKLELLKGNGEWILVVDDEEKILETTKMTLQAFNYQVLTASSGIEAMAVYAQHQEKISVVLMDMMMPSMDGALTIRALQKFNPLVNIIAVSGLVGNNKSAVFPEVKAFVAKPYTAEVLLQNLDRVLSQESTSVDSIKGTGDWQGFSQF